MVAALMLDLLANHSVPVPYIGLIAGSMKDQAISSFLPSSTNESRLPRLCLDSPVGTAGLWNAFFAPLHGVRLAAVLWYQGESDTMLSSRHTYRCSLSSLISLWRKAFVTPHPPLLVMLPILHPYHCKVPLGNAVVRDHQLAVAHALPGVMPVAGWDTTHKVKSHPRDKSVIANRAAAALCARLHHLRVPHTGPWLANVSCAPSNGGYTIHLAFRGPRRLHHLAAVNGLGRCQTSPFVVRMVGADVAPQDGQWRAVPLGRVQVEIGSSRVELSVETPDGVVPDRVRYAYFNTPSCTLYDTAGWPAMPVADLHAACGAKQNA
eukprot:GGOE01023301.1.p1 GENE.GGOE01023301.1~~GGOE01023301.1.p1  ORF type:complete len:321 (+),score=27.09 GGOE01023301.1:163-1125(+)